MSAFFPALLVCKFGIDLVLYVIHKAWKSWQPLYLFYNNCKSPANIYVLKL